MGSKHKKANKNATKGKMKVWKKGQSCSYNPQFNKHRLEAKKRVTFGNKGFGNLTEEKLAMHNKMLNDKMEEDNDDAMSFGADSAMTAFTNCSLPTFSRLLKNWQASSFLHKEMLAVLAAVTDILKANGGKETETEYFAALMTTLEVVDTDEGVTAVICLLSMVVKQLDESILKSQNKISCEVYMKLLLKYMNSDYGALLKNLLNILYCFLKVKTHWTESSPGEYKLLLEYTTHHKPKVRKAAHRIVQILLTHHIPESLSVHPGAKIAAKFCAEQLESSGGSNRAVFYVLSLLKDVIGIFPKAEIKHICETLFRVMTLSNVMVTSCCLDVLKGLFSSRPKPENLPVDLNGRIITALYDYQPNVNDVESLVNWLQVMESALVRLHNLDAKLCLSHLPKFFEVAIKCWQSNKELLLPIVACTLQNVLRSCRDPSSPMAEDAKRAMQKMFGKVEEALSYQYHHAWKYVLQVLATFFEVAGEHCHPVMIKCIRSLVDLHDTFEFAHMGELEKALGAAIHYLGPRLFLKAIPLQIDTQSEKPEFPQSWLLPLLRDSIQHTELAFFSQFFWPLANKLKHKVQALEKQHKVVESKLYDVIYTQIWSLLPGFCTDPIDLSESFKDIAQQLGSILKNEPSLRMTVLNSLRLLASSNLNSEGKCNLYAENYLRIFFGLYTTPTKKASEEKARLAVYDTLKVFLQTAEKQICEKLFAEAMDKLRTEQGPFLQQALIDLNKALLPYIQEQDIATLYECCKPQLKSNNHTIQKKAYGVIKEICSSESEPCRSFVTSHLDELRTLLCGTVSGLVPSARTLRLVSLLHIVRQLPEDLPFVTALLPEAVLCTKENSVKGRAAAYDLLVEIGHAFKRWKETNAMKDYMKVLLAGLAGSPRLMSATILAVGRVFYEFKEDMDSDLTNLIVENMCLLLTSSAREVVDSVLSFMKVLFHTLQADDLAQYLQTMVSSVTNLTKDNQRHFRFKAKELLTRITRKFGFEMISKMVPSTFQKQFANIRKLESRKSRKREDDSYAPSERSEGSLNDSDDEMPTEAKSKRTKKQKTKKDKHPWIEEGDEDNIVDFMDPAINKRILATKPGKEVEKKGSSFPMSEDGRLVIEDAPMDTKNAEDKKEVLAELGIGSKKSKKRKLEENSDDEEVPIVKKGIHRTTGQPKAIGAEFKAKKAGGDRKKGNVDPYAYVPFNRQALNKRKRVKLKGQFKNIVKAAKKGANVGTKKRKIKRKR